MELKPINQQSSVERIALTHTGLNSIEQVRSLRLLLDIGVDQKGVSLGVNILHHNLKTVEAARLRNLDLSAESLEKVLVHNAVGRGEESKNVRDEVAFVVIESVVPVLEIL